MEPNEEEVVTPEVNENEDTNEGAETIVIPKKDYENLKQTVGGLKREIKDLKKSKESPATNVAAPNTGDLDETQLDYLDLKGISDPEDVKIIEDIVKKTGQTVRQALKDEYVVSKLAANKTRREVQDATPSNTRRAGSQIGDVASATAKFKETGTLPTDRALADAVIDAVTREGNDRLPPWQR